MRLFSFWKKRLTRTSSINNRRFASRIFRPRLEVLEDRTLLSSYAVTDLGTLGGDSSIAFGINNAGDVVGKSATIFGSDHAFLYQNGVGMTDLGTLLGSFGSSEAFGINSAGQVVGGSSSFGFHAFQYQRSVGMTDLGTFGGLISEAFGINSAGLIVGYATTSNFLKHAFLYQKGVGMTDLDLFGQFSEAFGINSAVHIVGQTTTSSGLEAFLYENGLMNALGTLGGTSSAASGINDAGQVVGDSYTSSGFDHAFEYQNDRTTDLGGRMTDLGTLGGTSSAASGINNAGQIVGNATTSSGSDHAFLYQLYHGPMTDLNDLTAGSGWTLTQATAINDSGQIVGNGTNFLGLQHAFLLTPKPTVSAPANQNATEGASQSINLGSFSDPSPGPWTVDVNWGDGTPDTVYSTTAAGALGTQNHSYAEEGSYAVTVQVTNNLNQSDSRTFQVAVAGDATEGTSQAISLGSFSDPSPGPWTIDVNWKDGTPDTTFSTTAAGSLGTQNHYYAEEGSYTVTVTVTNNLNQSDSKTFQVAVADAPLNAAGQNLTAVKAVPTGSMALATFTDPGGAEALSNYSATLDWGDGNRTDTTGTITYNSGSGVFTVSGGHTYAWAGRYVVRITINHEALTTSVQDAITVFPPAILNAGDLDPTFGVGGTTIAQFPPSSDFPQAITVQSNGQPVVLGFSQFGTNKFYQAISRYTTDGKFDKRNLTFLPFDPNIVFVDGKIYAAGLATNGLVMCRYNSDLSLDITFGTSGVVLQSFNNIGSVSSINGVAVDASNSQFVLTGEAASGIFVARFNQDGSLDTNFAGTGIAHKSVGQVSSGNAVAVQLDGSVVVAGVEIAQIGTASQGILLRYTSKGDLDTNFGGGGTGYVLTSVTNGNFGSVAIQPNDHKIVAGGRDFRGALGTSFLIARYDSGGNPDPGFGTTGISETGLLEGNTGRSTVSVLTDGTIGAANGRTLLRYDTYGNLLSTYGNAGVTILPFSPMPQVLGVSFQSDGSAFLIGPARTNALNTFAIARVQSNGQLDASFGNNGFHVDTPFVTPQLATAAFLGIPAVGQSVQPNGGILLGSTVAFPLNNFGLGLAQLLPSGSPDTSFTAFNHAGGLEFGSSFGEDQFSAMAIQNDGKIVLAGQVFNNQMELLRFYPNGANDNNFDTNTSFALPQFVADFLPVGVVIEPNGNITVAAQAQTASAPETDFVLLQFNADGTINNAFGSYDPLLGSYGVARTKLNNAAFRGGAQSLVVQPDGNILVAGADLVAGQSVIARYNWKDGTLDPTFGTGGIVRIDDQFSNDDKQRLVLDSSGKILLASEYYVYRLTPTGAADTSFGTGGFAYSPGGAFQAMTVDQEGKITLAGTSFQNHFAVSRLRADGSIDTHFGAGGTVQTPLGSYDTAEAVSVVNGRIIASGYTDGRLGVVRYRQYNPAANFTLSTAASPIPGEPNDVTLTVNDAYGEGVGDYTGTVHFTSTDPFAQRPADYTFTLADHGRHVFSGGIVFGTPGSQTLTATDSTNGSVLGTIAVTVQPLQVSNTNDSGPGSLRQAILDADSIPGAPNTIQVAIGSGPQSIHLLSALPTITDSVVLDATGQPGYAGTPLIELDGSGAGAEANGLTITGPNCLIKGLVINRFSGYGLVITGSSATGNIIAGNYIGTDTSGSVALGNVLYGVLINGGASNNTIGGRTAGAGNVISGNGLTNIYTGGIAIGDAGTSNNLVAGNLIGTDVTGMQRLGNAWDNIFIGPGASGNIIGGTTPDARNVISCALAFDGVEIYGSANSVAGNFIGTDVTGTAAFGNAANGVSMAFGASGNTIGGTTAGARNIISANGGSGVSLWTSGPGNLVEGNYIGIDKNSTAAMGNGFSGVEIVHGSSNNTIGGGAPGAGNVISGNAYSGLWIQDSGTTNNVVAGNLIGTNSAGTKAIGNGFDGVSILNGASYNRIGTNGPNDSAERNVISGSIRYQGVSIWGVTTTNNVVAGNYIGTDINGTNPLGNARNGVQIWQGANGNLIGGASGVDPVTGKLTGQGNVISGNASAGVLLSGSNANMVQGNYIGTKVTSISSLPNGWAGIVMAGGASNNLIGADTPGAGNVVSGNSSEGIGLADTGTINNKIQGNDIGTDATGNTAVPNGWAGIAIYGGASNNIVGGNTPGARNLISGNRSEGVAVFSTGTNNNLIQGNYIGTKAAGIAAVPNGWAGIVIADGAYQNTFGGTAPGAGNVISGNSSDGVLITDAGTTGNLVQGNFIGTDFTGTNPLGNGGNGITISFASGNLIGGTSASARNIISANRGQGIQILNTLTSAGGLTLTSAAIAAGFRLSTFATNFPFFNTPDGGFGPAGVAFPAGGGVLVSDGPGNIRLFPTDLDGQNAFSVPPAQFYGFLNANNVAQLNGRIFMTQYLNGAVVEINPDGTFKQTIVSGLGVGTSGVAADPFTGHLYVCSFLAGQVLDVDPVTNTYSTFLNIANAGGSALSADGKTLYIGQGSFTSPSTNDMVGFDTATGAQVYGPVTVPYGDGMVVGAGTLAGNLFIACANGTVVELNLTTNVQTVIASGGSRGAFGIVDPNNGTLLLALSSLLARLTPPPGGGFVGGPIPASNVLEVGNVIQGNYIGTDSTGTVPLGNGLNGVFISGSSNNLIGGTAAGAGNLIAFNTGAGVVVGNSAADGSAVSNSIRGNSIFGNALGIDLGNDGVTPNDSQGHAGPSNRQNFPVLTLVATSGTSVTITGTFNSGTLNGLPFQPNTNITLDFYSNGAPDPSGYGQGQRFFGTATVRTDAAGNASFNITFSAPVALGQFITATATDPAGNTSEFSQAVRAQAPLTVTTSSSIMLVGNSPPPLTGSVNGAPFTGAITYTTSYSDQVTVTLSTTATAASGVGQYTITASLSGAKAANYFIDRASSTIGTMYVVGIGPDPTSTTGAEAVAFWDNRGNKSLITAADLASLDALFLVSNNGKAFDPKVVAQLQTWLQLASATSSNMAYQLSVQLAVMDLNVLTGYVQTTDLVYAGGLLPYATGYGLTGLTSGGFISIGNLMASANAALLLDPTSFSGDPFRTYEAALTAALQAANNNSSFVQQELLWNLVGLYPTL